MRVHTIWVRSAGLCLAAILTVTLGGCGDDSGLAKRYPVSGQVTYKGAPVQKGTISFVPEKGEGRGASGQIENGSYTLTTNNPGDGAFPGNYIVTVDTREIDEAAAKAEREKFAKAHGITTGLVQLPQEVQAKMMQNAKSSVPTKYMTPDASDLRAEVKAQSNKFDFELKDN